MELVRCQDSEDISRKAAELFVQLAGDSISSHGRFTVALSGGSTPKILYTRLAGIPDIPWNGIHLFWGDERCVPPDHRDSNYRMTREALLDSVTIPPANIHRIRGEDPQPESAALDYEQEIRNLFGTRAWPRFDLVFLGMGDDGHTASLFPGTSALKVTDRLVVSNYVEKFAAYRITFTAPLINHAAHIAFLISGESKAIPLKAVLQGARQPDIYPSQLIQPVDGNLTLFVDHPAAKML